MRRARRPRQAGRLCAAVQYSIRPFAVFSRETKSPPSTGTEGYAFRGTTLVLPRRDGGTLGGAITGASPSPVFSRRGSGASSGGLPACTNRRLSARERPTTLLRGLRVQL